MNRNSKPIISASMKNTWAQLCADIELGKAEHFSDIIGTSALIFAVVYHNTGSLEKAEHQAKIPARSGRAVLDCALHAVKAHYGNALMLIG